MKSSVTLCLFAAIIVGLVIAPLSADDKPLAGIYTLPDIPLGEFQNDALPGSIDDDHGMLLGAIGSSMFHDSTGPRDEFWMLTDRGPNGPAAKDAEGKDIPNSITFLVPEFNPCIVLVRVRDGVIEIKKTVEIVTPLGHPVTGISNLPDVDPTPYDAFPDSTGLQPRVPFNVNGIDS